MELVQNPADELSAPRPSTTPPQIVYAIEDGRGAFVFTGDWDDETSLRSFVVDPRGTAYSLLDAQTIEKLGYDEAPVAAGAGQLGRAVRRGRRPVDEPRALPTLGGRTRRTRTAGSSRAEPPVRVRRGRRRCWRRACSSLPGPAGVRRRRRGVPADDAGRELHDDAGQPAPWSRWTSTRRTTGWPAAARGWATGVVVAVVDSGVGAPAGVEVVERPRRGARTCSASTTTAPRWPGLVAGAARADDAGGPVGIAPDAQILDLQVYDDPTGDNGTPILTANVVQALDVVLARRAAGMNVRVVNISLNVAPDEALAERVAASSGRPGW